MPLLLSSFITNFYSLYSVRTLAKNSILSSYGGLQPPLELLSAYHSISFLPEVDWSFLKELVVY